ncbi:hypothetical protein GGU10DRAFT_83431 [Lentinula aff. detonsa]|uniref:Uncharacterized protein n=1 Tax=Lentinula aff. detonsa TaxID=2804958 RepID=A0AA38KPU7_9AGAR|nr:hypothetical protein GGU10DRAFT_83431 [Lentinula aff. detonsa]
MLKEQQDAVIVVAAVTEGCPLVDFIPGDHDHDVVVQGDKITIINTDVTGRIRIVKSESDFGPTALYYGVASHTRSSGQSRLVRYR